ncbi:MAG: hypothetical protein RLZZ169_1028 [Pseudomonadota bacterium]|jgi:hypothetical protein
MSIQPHVPPTVQALPEPRDGVDSERFFRNLITLSLRRQFDAWHDIDWSGPPDPDRPWMPFEFTTLFGSAQWSTLSEGQRIRLTQLETLNLFSMTLAGETDIKRELSPYPGRDVEEALYLSLFMREEANHSLMFRKLFALVGATPYRYVHLKFPRSIHPGLERLNAFMQTLIAEEVLTHFNALLMDADIPDVIRAIHRWHHLDESRHIAMGRTVVRKLWEAARSDVEPAALAAHRRYAHSYGVFFCRDLFNTDVYRELGLSRPRAMKNQLQADSIGENFAPLKRIRHFLDSLP